MEEIRLIQLGPGNGTMLSNLALVLSRMQDTFDFIFENDLVSLPIPSLSVYPTRVLEDSVISYMAERRYSAYPIAVTEAALEDDLASSTDNRLTLLSTHDWSSFSSFPVTTALQYLVAGALFDRLEIGSVHYETRGCPNDYCDVRSDIDLGIAKAEFCHDCRTAILACLEKGTLPLQQVIGIYRILDAVSARRICFILMPFRKKFEPVFETLKASLEAAGLQPIRADEVLETRSVMQIIYEMIGRSEAIVADLTDRNPNVFYELGYAHALGKSTILVTQKAKDVPFDLRHRQYVLYDPRDLAATLGNKLGGYFSRDKRAAGSTIGEGGRQPVQL